MLSVTSLLFTPVSYTHLDVYKRQHYMLPDGEEREFTKADKDKVEEQMHAPVSYTHLDVYKRQAWMISARAFC